MDLLRWLEVVTGVVMILITFYDVFKSVVLPRPAINKFVLIRRAFFMLWNFWLWANERQAPARREGWLATFGPIAVLFMFGTWAMILMFGYAFIIDGFRDQIKPMPTDFWDSFYFSATTLVPAQLRRPRARAELVFGLRSSSKAQPESALPRW